LAGEAGGADLEIHLEDAAIAEGQRVLDPHALRQPVRILDGVRLAQQVREGDRHPLADGDRGLPDVLPIPAQTPPHPPPTGAVASGLKLNWSRRSPARRMWKATRDAKSPRVATATRQSNARTSGAPAGKATIQIAVPSRLNIAIGTRYFQHITII